MSPGGKSIAEQVRQKAGTGTSFSGVPVPVFRPTLATTIKGFRRTQDTQLNPKLKADEPHAEGERPPFGEWTTLQ